MNNYPFDDPNAHKFPIEMWRKDVANNTTELGYSDWLEDHIESYHQSIETEIYYILDRHLNIDNIPLNPKSSIEQCNIDENVIRNILEIYIKELRKTHSTLNHKRTKLIGAPNFY